MSAKWIDAEDKLLRQLTSIGLNAKQIHSTYSTVYLLQGRSVKAIEQRLCYLNKPAEQRRQDDMASMDDVDRLIEAIDNARDRICNRLDSIALSLAHLNRTMEEPAQDTVLSKETMQVFQDIKKVSTEALDSVNTIRNDQKNILNRIKDKNKQTERR